MFYLSNVIWTMNDQKMLIEHIDFSRKLGVEHFLIYDGTNFSPYPEDIFKGQNDIEIISTGNTDFIYNLNSVYREAAKYLENKSRWVLYSDTDEMLIPNKTDDVRVMLQDYEQFSQIGFNWLTFGSSNLKKEPIETAFEAFTRVCENDWGFNSNVKPVVCPKDIVSCSPHFMYLKPGCIYVNEHKQQIITDPNNITPGSTNIPVTHDIGYIAHYRFRSEEHFNTVREAIHKSNPLRFYDNKPKDKWDFAHWENDVLCNKIEYLKVKDLYLKLSK